jgi:hypothetical protein
MIVYFDNTKLIKEAGLKYRWDYETGVVVCSTKLDQLSADDIIGYLGVIFKLHFLKDTCPIGAYGRFA